MNDVFDDAPIFSGLDQSVPLRRYGYNVIRHPGSAKEFQELKKAFEELLAERLSGFSGRNAGVVSCEKYHEHIRGLAVEHHAFVKATTRRLPAMWSQNAYISRLADTAGEVVGQRLRVYNDVVEYRVVRPKCSDNNPWHRDHWFSYFAPLVNIYLPLSGSYVDSSLQVVPFSHLWSDEECAPTFRAGESKTAKGDILYSVPEIKSCNHPIVGHRIDIVPGDFAMFSPRMVHGAGSNDCPSTRFSLEFRLERDS